MRNKNKSKPVIIAIYALINIIKRYQSTKCNRDLGLEHRSGQTIDNELSICCFFAKRAALRR